MPLSAGARLGPYEILSALGAGGMGEVYRARDTKLDRDVAIKILPETFADDTERIARFRREAKTLAALNHPNIAHIYGLEESSGVSALVMELVDGEDLAQRLKRGSIPIAEALAIGKQIAGALEASHTHGVIHRDLKPANIKLRPDGTVKVLDFGLAKALDRGVNTSQPRDLSASPTITSSEVTMRGVILGTAAYMSPEQARGMSVDTRADVWAFGCVLYEMLTGHRVFDGQSASDILARVIEREPDWDRLPAAMSPALRTYLKRCLHKDPKQRVQAIGDVRLALEGAFELAPPQIPRSAAERRRAVFVAAATIMASVVILGTLGWVAMRRAEPTPPRVSRLQLTPSGASALTLSWNYTDLAITPDGSRIVYAGNRGTQLFVRALEALAPESVFTGAIVNTPFVSPDGQWIGFADGRSVLKKVPVGGGPAVTIATVDAAGFAGATWGPDDTIIVATAAVETGLQRVAAAGGSMTVLTRPDQARGEADHFWPEMLPGGRAVLFTITPMTGGLGAAQVAVLDLEAGTQKTVVRGASHARYVSSSDGGHLLYAAGGALRVVRFDLERLETNGPPVTIVADVLTTFNGGVDAVVAGNGTMAYVPGSERTPRTLVWVDREGRETPISIPLRPYLLPALSPDGTRVMVFGNDQEYDLWLWDFARTTLTRLTLTPGVDGIGVWTPDSRRVIFASERTGVRNLFQQVADGTGTTERLTESPNTQYPSAVTPDGRLLIFTEEHPPTASDVMALALDGTSRVTPLVRSPFNDRNGSVSPDGSWLAYEANDSGRFEIYVRPFPDVNSGRWAVSANGGTRPIWTRNGQELFYVSPTGALMRVGVARGPSWQATTPTQVVKEGYYTIPQWWGLSYDVSADGQRFLMLTEGGADGIAAPPSIVVVQNWAEELKALKPARP
jgi:serine/threonine-protein kinase